MQTAAPRTQGHRPGLPSLPWPWPAGVRRTLALAVALCAPSAWAAFMDNGDGTVTDDATGLVWDRCTYGLTGDTCSAGAAFSGSWTAALAQARQANVDAYKRFSDWRVPNVKELESLVKINAHSPALDTAAFPPGTQQSEIFWSSTTAARGPGGVLGVNFFDGSIFTYGKTFNNHVRLVRGGWPLASFDGLGGNPNTITFADPGAQDFGTTLALAATASSGLPVSYAATGVCTLSGGVASYTAAGDCAIEATQAGDANWVAAIPVSHTFAVHAVAPRAPVGVTVTLSGPGQATVSWTAPADTGGSAITGYAVQAVEDGSQTCTPVPATATTCDVTGLTNGETYTFTVVAATSAGDGPASTSSHAVTPTWRSFTGNAPTGTGAVTASFTGGGDACTFQQVQLTQPAASGPTAPPPGLSFPHGLLGFELSHCDQSPVTMTVAYPDVPASAQYWKLQDGAWTAYTATVGGITVEFTLQDGGAGDEDNMVNGRIVDPGGLGIRTLTAGPVTPVPTLGTWAMVLLSALLAGVAPRRRGRPEA
ncbi:IPTL-CTERM sorting domain-containing protein [Ottowia sp.]|uniref:IPTL-CTERM sorting domain-containing protein n=1 Tax=Ottowia sp. TaxID=1898956 RepID=UPI0025D36B81|nr:IPTL-CTERM sorting domain-containing protein [Ottowia sp.]MBK6613262.1 IPTL-CTERM sorting domain-containing protein [Ottowia sp.]MBK6747631.1 IPTL-CTERM sorting domain-containing protein [Ottowia sp.]